MTPVAPDPVMNTLSVHAAGRARQLLRIAGDLEIDPPFGCVEVDLDHFPRRLQSQRGRKQGFDTNTYCGDLKLKLRGQRRILRKRRLPLPELQVAGHDQAASFVQCQDHLEEQVSLLPVKKVKIEWN